MRKFNNIDELTSDDLNELFVKIITNEYTQEEYDLFQKWTNADPKNEAEFTMVKSYWNADIIAPCSIQPQKELNKLMKRVSTPKKVFRMPVKRIIEVTSVAAALAFGVLAGWGITKINEVPIEKMTYMSGAGVSQFTLPDGTQISLNKNSKLDWRSDFGKKERRVHLEGEGFFDVKRMEDKKFIVDLDDASITVKGTVFNAYNNLDSGDKGAALVEGSIEFNAAEQHLLLTPSHQIDYNRFSNELKLSEFDPSIETAWKDNLLRYKSLTFENLIKKISYNFNIDIQLVSKNIEGDYSGALDLGLSIPQMLDIVTLQAGVSWYKRDGIFYITR